MIFRKRGMALPIALALVLCLGVWIGSLSYTMSQSRNRFTQMVKMRKAYFLARSGLQHFFLKVKTFQRLYPQAMLTLYQAKREEWPILSKSFSEDIIMPADQYPGEFNGKYGISGFNIESVDNETAYMAIKIISNGSIDGMKESISRVYKVTR